MSIPTRCPFGTNHETTVVESGEYDPEIGCIVGTLDCFACGLVEVDYISHPDAVEVIDARRGVTAE